MMTGYQYFGARYYNSDISVWLSVDPLADKYPSQSPYSYVGNRSINVIDPNGMWEKDADGNWVAQKGDSPGSLAKDAGISQSKAEEVMRNYNKENGNKRSSDIMVYKDDKVSISGNEISSSDGSSLSHTNPKTESTDNSKTSNPSNNMAIGAMINIGSNFKDMGGQVSCGILGNGPGSRAQLFLSFGYPDKNNWFDFSASYQFLFGSTYKNDWSLEGDGRNIGVGAYSISGSYSTDKINKPTYQVLGIGPSVGARANGSSLSTKTITADFVWPVMITPVGFKF
jgi:hypothetical protein